MIWRDSLKIGVKTIDEQHQELFKRFNNFIQVVRSDDYSQKEKKEKISDTLSFLADYVVTHFDSEEAIQKKYNYPNHEEHHQAHEAFKAKIANFEDRFEKEEYNEDFVQEFSGQILTWLINHVAAEDQKIAEHIGRQDYE
ncbi:MAG: bacteriohemerythrin [Halanaerobacter sp.]